MGLTGSGKSYFVSMAANTPPPPKIAQLESCTLGVIVASFHHKCGKTVHLIDTPGFNDTHRTDGEILHELAFWLLKSYTHDIRLSGVVYLHSISDNRIQGSALRALNIFKNLVGKENYHGVILATTMWDKLDDDDYDSARARQKELMTNLNFWGDMKQGRSQVMALRAGRTSVEEIVNHIATEDKRLSLRIQCQMSEPENYHIHETDAGKVLYKELYEEKRNMEQKLNDLRKQLGAAVDNHHIQKARELRKQLLEVSESVMANKVLMKEFEKPTTELNEYFEKQVKRDLQKVKMMTAANSKRLGELEREMKPRGAVASLDVPHNPIKRYRSMVTLKPQGDCLNPEGKRDEIRRHLEWQKQELEMLRQTEQEIIDRKKTISLAKMSLGVSQGSLITGIVGTLATVAGCCIM